MHNAQFKQPLLAFAIDENRRLLLQILFSNNSNSSTHGCAMHATEQSNKENA